MHKIQYDLVGIQGDLNLEPANYLFDYNSLYGVLYRINNSK